MTLARQCPACGGTIATGTLCCANECCVPDCSKPAAVRQMCHMHYSRWQRHGSVDGHSPRLIAPGASVMRKLLSGIVSDDGCWIWGRGRSDGGYGHLHVNGKTRGTHVLMWEQINACPVPTGMHVCHSCDNPPCINPSHLWIGTRAQNMADMGRKDRGTRRQRTCDVDGCDREHDAKGYCSYHYHRIVRAQRVSA